MREIIVLSDVDELSDRAAQAFVSLSHEAISERGRFMISLAGGSTPKGLYHVLTTSAFRDRVDWANVFFYFGDERNVPPESDDSNFRMANETLFEPLGISEDNVFEWITILQPPDEIARMYQLEIELSFNPELLHSSNSLSDLVNGDEPSRFPRFDLVILGMGADGHTASLFPYTSALTEAKKIAVAHFVEKLGSYRLTLTFPVFNNAANVMLLVAGADKAEPLKEVLEGVTDIPRLPAQGINPRSGQLSWFVDKAAARLLRR